MSFKYTDAVFAVRTWSNKLFTANEKLVLLVLAERADGTGYCFPGYTQLKEDSGLSRGRISEAINNIRELKLMTILKGRNRCFKYQLDIEAIRSFGGNEGVEVTTRGLHADYTRTTQNDPGVHVANTGVLYTNTGVHVANTGVHGELDKTEILNDLSVVTRQGTRQLSRQLTRQNTETRTEVAASSSKIPKYPSATQSKTRSTVAYAPVETEPVTSRLTPPVVSGTRAVPSPYGSVPETRPSPPVQKELDPSDAEFEILFPYFANQMRDEQDRLRRLDDSYNGDDEMY